MRKQFFAIAGVAGFAVAAIAGLSALNGAEAQSAAKAPVILIVDQAQLVGQSKAGQTIPAQAEKVRDSVAKELEAEATKLKNDIEKYQKNASLMSDEVRQKTEQELQMRQQYGLPQRAQVMEKAFTATVQNARGEILLEARPIMKDIIEKRGATIVLDRSSVMYAAIETDITQEVIAELDKKMKSVEVKKISLAEVEKQIIAAQAKAQQENKKK